MNLLQRHIGFDVVTHVKWRTTEGMVLQTCVLTPTTRTPLLLADVRPDQPYDVFAQAEGQPWRLIYEVRPQPGGGLVVDWKSM